MRNQVNPQIQMKETDLNTVRFTFSVLDDGLACDLTGSTVQLTVKKPSTMTIVQDCTITDAINGICEVILPNQAYIEVGNHSGELVITKGDLVSVTRSFEYASLSAILDDNTMESTNDWTVLHEIMLSRDLKPILGSGSPNTAITPEYLGQTYLDTVGLVMYFASTLLNDGWLPFGSGEGGGGTVSWDDILLKPTTFTPSAHEHLMTEITGLSDELNAKLESVPAEYLTQDEGDLRYELIGENVPKTGTTDPTGVIPDFVGQIYVDTVAKESYVANSITGDWQSISMDELGGGGGSIDWTAITGKPDTFTPSTHNHDTVYYKKNEALTVDSGEVVVASSFANVNGKIVMLIHPTVNSFQSSDALNGAKKFRIEGFEGGQLPLLELNSAIVNAMGKLQENGIDIAEIYAPIDHDHLMSDITDLATALLGKSDTGHLHTGTYYPANGGNINGSITISNKGDMVQQLRFNTDRPWTFKQKGADANAELMLTPDANTKIFRIRSPLGTDALEVKVDDVGANAYINSPVIKENGVNISTKFSPADHSHTYASLTEKPTTFTPPLATNSTVGGAKVGNGLRMGGVGNEWLTIQDGVGIKTNSQTLAVDVDKTVLDGWYAKSTQGLSIWKGTQVEYDGLTPDSNTLYFITG
jgi:hypothetical protein